MCGFSRGSAHAAPEMRQGDAASVPHRVAQMGGAGFAYLPRRYTQHALVSPRYVHLDRVWPLQGGAGYAALRRHWRIDRSTDHLVGGFYDGSGRGPWLQPIQQCLEVGGSDRVGITAVANVVEY